MVRKGTNDRTSVPMVSCNADPVRVWLISWDRCAGLSRMSEASIRWPYCVHCVHGPHDTPPHPFEGTNTCHPVLHRFPHATQSLSLKDAAATRMPNVSRPATGICSCCPRLPLNTDSPQLQSTHDSIPIPFLPRITFTTSTRPVSWTLILLRTPAMQLLPLPAKPTSFLPVISAHTHTHTYPSIRTRRPR